MKNKIKNALILFFIVLIVSCTNSIEKQLDLSNATILISSTIKSPVHKTAVDILTEEIGKRTELQLKQSDNWESNTIIALALGSDTNLLGEFVPNRKGDDFPELKKEGYRIFHENKNGKNILWIIGADARGVLYGIGKLLRIAEMQNQKITIAQKLNISTSPEYAIRGHQFGYRNTANSWDAWTVEQFDQHFREQVIFGANSFENIPFQSPSSSPHFKINPQEMEIRLSEICNKYDADYWVWTPAPHDLTIKNAHQKGLDIQEDFFSRVPRLDAVFVPGGDPGENHPKELIPYLKDLSVILHKYHPKASIWVSLQGFNKEKTDYFFKYLKDEKPEWLRGIVHGPSSPPIDIERKRLPKKYMHRLYPDITHSVRCSYPVERWDQAFALTLGREGCNPQPFYYAKVHNRDVIYTDGFLSYSDGSHDDVNKVVWSQMGWDSKSDVRNIIVEYCRFFFGSKIAEESADGILALEENWVGPLLGNKVVGETLELWKKLENENPKLADNWRWQQLVMRAYYDAYIQDRLTYEKGLVPEEIFDKKYLDNLLNYNDVTGSAYYKAILQNLFFATLNTEMNKDKPNSRKFVNGQYLVHNLYRYGNLFNDKTEALKLFENIPFLNGGLFECLDRKNENDNVIRIDYFSENAKNQKRLKAPDYLFFGEEQIIDLSDAYGNKKKSKEKVKPIIDILNSYKFTIAENTPIEEEVALDPELLGKVFENLLASYNPETKTTARKQTGSFYTPREIVNYMVDESLIAYFITKLLPGSDNTNEKEKEKIEAKLRQLFEYNEQPHQFDNSTVDILINAIDEIKILDPAAGSGAFPMGILHRLVFLLHKLDPHNEKWKQKQIDKISEIEDPTVREQLLTDVEESFTNNELDYGRKLYLIENCIYGVDIQPVAVQIAKLCFFISLVVDQKVNPQKENFGIRPLPNLETKFVAANTLIGLTKEEDNLFTNPNIDEIKKQLKNVRHRYFTARTHKTKEKYRKKDKELRQKLSDMLTKEHYLQPEDAKMIA